KGGEHGGRDHRERTLGRLETKLAFRSGEEDHYPESREREGDSLNLESLEAFPKEGGGEHRDEGGRRGNDEGGRPRGDGRIGFSEVQEEVIAGETDERKEGEIGQVCLRRKGAAWAGGRKASQKPDLGSGNR